MNKSKKHWGVVGGGIMGMQIANRLSQRGHKVTLLEAGDSLGGLTSTWNLNGIQWDKYYHIILLSDLVLRGLLNELGLKKELKWVETKSGFYTEGKLYSMSNSIEFLRFPPLSLLDKFRLGFTIFYASRVKDWKYLEGQYVADWLKKWSGKNTFNKIWLPLLRAKLGENYKHTSAAFIWATIQRMYAARRTGLKKEMFGYVQGGYSRILDVFLKRLINQKVNIQTAYKASRIKANENGQVIVKNQNGEISTFDEVVLTVPSSVAAKICKGLSKVEQKKLEGIEYLGVICVSVLLKKSLSPFYVTNITDETPFTGIIEMTNMVKPDFFGGYHLVYLPKYVKQSDPEFKMSNEEVKKVFWNNLLKMYAFLSEDDLIDIQVTRTPNVFALSTINYSEHLPNISTSIPGVHILNSAHIVNGTLNVNETLQVVDRELTAVIEKANQRQIPTTTHE